MYDLQPPPPFVNIAVREVDYTREMWGKAFFPHLRGNDLEGVRKVCSRIEAEGIHDVSEVCDEI